MVAGPMPASPAVPIAPIVAVDSAISTLDRLLSAALARGASDIHIDPHPDMTRVRFRIDGSLTDEPHLSTLLHATLIARIKVLASLRTDEHQLPHDGRFRITVDDAPLDIRVSIAPTYHGENAVLRLLVRPEETATLESLGFSDVQSRIVLKALTRPDGLVLATGPTGSGKTTTLYTLLRALNLRARSLITIEDPIEYSLPGATQIQAYPDGGLTFARGLRSMLRQDPDVIMVGEVRDEDTARLAVNAALTGHLILSTLHTNDAVTTLPRLRDMHIEPYLIAATASLIIAQRLARRICTGCRTEERITRAARIEFANTFPSEDLPGTAFRGSGCASCAGTGYRGRIGLYEVLAVDSHIREGISGTLTTERVRALAESRGMRTLRKDALAKASDGLISLADALTHFHE